MRLLKINQDDNFSLTRFGPNNIPPYAILSHTWEADDQELTFEDMMTGTGRNKDGYRKIQFCGDQARKDGLKYFWVDSCCIDKTSSAELSEAINSMFRWYSEARLCYVYLSDFYLSDSLSFIEVGDPEARLRGLRWFQRGWTLQELIAPKEAVFFTATWKVIGTKRSLCGALSSLTGIPSGILLLEESLHRASTAQKMSWVSNRSTTREEDMAYCLLGLFDISIAPLYGEGIRNAFRRLQEEIIKVSSDDSIFIWHGTNEYLGPLAESPADFEGMGTVKFRGVDFLGLSNEYYLTNGGLRMQLPVKMMKDEQYIGLLTCTASDDNGLGYVGIHLHQISETGIYLRARKPPKIFSGMYDPGWIRGDPELRMKSILIAGTHYRQSLEYREPKPGETPAWESRFEEPPVLV